MKNIPLTLGLLTAILLVAGCDKPADQTNAQQMDKVSQDTKAAAQDLKDYTYAQKTEFIAKMRAQSAEIHTDLDQLAAKIDRASDKAKADAQPKLQALRDQVAKLDKQIDDAKDASESTWNDVKSGFKKGYGEVKDGFTQARQWVSDKIAP
jgi:chromosome segregation ATPase